MRVGCGGAKRDETVRARAGWKDGEPDNDEPAWSRFVGPLLPPDVAKVRID